MANINESLAAGIRHHRAGDLRTAERMYREILQRESQNADAWHLLGVIAHQVGKQELAIDLMGRAVARNPRVPTFHSNLGGAYQAVGKLDDSVQCLRRALLLKPDYVEAHSNLGMVLQKQGKLADAVAACRRAIELNPDYAEAHSNLGMALNELGMLDAAVDSCQRAIDLRPDFAEAYNNQAIALKEKGQVEEALAAYRRAIELKPDYADAHRNLGLALLFVADYDGGWQEYEWRRQTDDSTVRDFAQPIWDGRSGNRTILVHAEQGLGDTIQFVRFLPSVQRAGLQVILECQPPLLKLLRDCDGIDRLVTRGEALPEFDVHSPLLSLPCILGTSAATIPAQIPYLSIDPELVARWGQQLSRHAGMKVGICWQGNPKFFRDRFRSIPLRHFTPLTQIPNVTLISLQKGHGLEQLEELKDTFSLVNLSDQLVDFTDTAAAMMNLDLMITSDTSVAHLAGALGVPVWLAVRYAPDWRWQRDREDCPWYPTMRLFRQTEIDDWESVFQRIAADLDGIARCGPPVH